jgi:hypothetical protein
MGVCRGLQLQQQVALLSSCSSRKKDLLDEQQNATLNSYGASSTKVIELSLRSSDLTHGL